MTLYVFTGPTLSPVDARAVFDAVYLPPVKQGDLYRVASEQRPRAIGIIDGYFQQVPSVWHKEILWAMAQGIHVFGSASMGALRAAELSPFGMQGSGVVFTAYCEGLLQPYCHELFEDDDEVAVVHGLSATGYAAMSEAMVNIRCTMAEAERSGIISTATRNALVCIGKGLFYPDRSYEKLLANAADQGVPDNELQALREWLPEGRVNQKRKDALEMLSVMRAFCLTDPGPKRVTYRFEHTTLWEESTASCGPIDVDPVGKTDNLQTDRVLDEFRLQGKSYGNAMRAAMHRMLALKEFDQRRLTVNSNGVRKATDGFRREVGLHSRKDVDCWLSENDLSPDDFKRLMEDEARLCQIESLLEPKLSRYIVDCLRLNGEYARLMARSREKHDALSSEDVVQSELDDLTALRLSAWYFERQLGCDIPDDIDAFAAHLGFPSTAAFHYALLREYLYLSKKEPDENG